VPFAQLTAEQLGPYEFGLIMGVVEPAIGVFTENLAEEIVEKGLEGI
jgi:hypothetical protein